MIEYEELPKEALLGEVARLRAENQALRRARGEEQALAQRLQELHAQQAEHELRQARSFLERHRRADEEERRLRLRFEALDREAMALGTALVAVPDGSSVREVIAGQVREAVGASLAVLGWFGEQAGEVSFWVGGTAEGPCPVAEIEASPARMAAIAEAVAARRSVRRDDAAGCFLAVPIGFGDRLFGVVCVAGGRRFDAEDQRTVELLVERGGLALEIVRLQARNQGRLHVLGETGRLLSDAPDPETLHAALARLPVPWLSDFCLFYRGDALALRLAAVAHRDAERQARLAEACAAVPPSALLPEGLVAQAWQQRASVKAAAAPAGAELLGAAPLLVVPLVVREEVLGLLVLGQERPVRRFDDVDLSSADEIGQRAALVLDHARLVDELQAALRDRDDLLAVVSHDLRSPLFAVRLSAQVLVRSLPVGDRGRRQLELIVRSADRMNRLIEDLQQAARIRAGRFAVERAPHRPGELLEELAGDVEPMLESRGVRLEVEVAPDLPDMLCDRHCILQVLLNLVGNAAQIVERGSTIRVVARPGDGVVWFDVIDRGPGIAEADLPHIFERYWSRAPTGRRGAGLGLYIASGIVEAHEGRILVESRPGGGTTFSFCVPQAVREPGG